MTPGPPFDVPMTMVDDQNEPKEGADDIEASRMTLREHLDELRVRLMRATIALVIAFVVLYSYRVPVNRFIQRPYEQAWERLEDKLAEVKREQVEAGSVELEDAFIEGEPNWRLREPERYLAPLSSFQAGGPFFVNIRICFLLSLFIAGPVFIWELWMFIAAGLYRQEKRVVYAFLPPSMILFAVGVIFGFTAMVPAAIYFTQADGLGALGIARQMNLDFYLQFLRGLSLALGLIFQLPIFQIALSRAGMIDPKLYAQYRGHVAIALLVFAAIITPPDPVTQVLLAGPAIVLWEIGYWCSRAVYKGKRSPVETEELSAATGA